MSQYDFGNLESPLSGTSFFNTHLEPWRNALHSNHAGSSRPSYAVASMTWVNTTTNPHVLNYFDGAQDIPLGYIDISTNSFIPAGLLLNNTTATTNPTVNDDSADGYGVGSKWVNVTNDLVFELVDSSVGAAIWKQMVDTNSTQTLSGKTLTSPTINGGTMTGITDLAVADGGTGASTASGARSNLGAAALGSNAWAGQQSNAPTALTDASTVAVDFSANNRFTLNLSGNRTLGNPSNALSGQSGCIQITQDSTGSRTLAYSSNWKFAGGITPTLSTAANSLDVLYYEVINSTLIHASLAKDVK